MKTLTLHIPIPLPSKAAFQLSVAVLALAIAGRMSVDGHYVGMLFELGAARIDSFLRTAQ